MAKRKTTTKKTTTKKTPQAAYDVDLQNLSNNIEKGRKAIEAADARIVANKAKIANLLKENAQIVLETDSMRRVLGIPRPRNLSGGSAKTPWVATAAAAAIRKAKKPLTSAEIAKAIEIPKDKNPTPASLSAMLSTTLNNSPDLFVRQTDKDGESNNRSPWMLAKKKTTS